jgi:transposase-like protein
MLQPWQILKRAIPDGRVEEVAKRLGVSPDTVRRWRREPESDDAPLSTGRVSPLDRIEGLVDAVFLVNPPGAHEVAEHSYAHYLSLAETRSLTGTVKDAAAVALSEMVKAVNAINLDAGVEEVDVKIAQAAAQLEEVKRHVRVACASRNGMHQQKP